ncbi:MAG: undecaprenyl-diphosphate phosphatase [Candidatus Latescibacteria bacterium]|nr:undecaprenyl-diphosphate phosphatase [Candidatus Latescibacterota bacterium]
MSTFEAILLGLVQGLTEFLPVSSSGHLVLARTLLGVSGEGITFEVMVHFGTFLAIVTVFRGEILKMIVSLLQGIGTFFGRKGIQQRLEADGHLRLALWIVIGSIPAGFLGLLFEDYIEQAFSNPILVSGALLVTGSMVWSTRYVKETGGEVGWKDAILIGAAQAFAMIPGISRSGSTIVTGLWRKVDRAKAAEFSFLLALPVIFGATLLKLKDVFEAPPSSTEMWSLIVGTATAYASGYVAIRVLLGIVRKGKLDRFAYYCWAVGLVALFLQLVYK